MHRIVSNLDIQATGRAEQQRNPMLAIVGIVMATTVMMLLAPAFARATAEGGEPIGWFVDPPSPYYLGTATDVELSLIPASGVDNVLFQVWSNVSNSVEAVVLDSNSPWIYPGSALDTVTPGQGYIQALLRDADDQIIEIVSVPTMFVEVPNPLHVPGDVATIQEAINIAASGGEIIVAPGIYNESIEFAGRPVHLRSSAGPEKTIIDGSGLPGSAVYLWNGEGPGTTLEGFTFSGWSRAMTIYPSVDSHITVQDCIFTANGKGISLGPSGGELFVHNCVFLNNGSTDEPDTVGGAISNTGSSLSAVDCLFVGNSAYYGGAIHLENTTSNLLTDCTFLNNTATYSGGAVYSLLAPTHMTNCAFENNHAILWSGGAVLSAESWATFQNCQFTSNLAGWRGGAVSSGGGLNMSDCQFAGNVSESGGAIFGNAFCIPTLSNCTFLDNVATENGGGICFEATHISITDSEFDTNHAGGSGGGMYIGNQEFGGHIIVESSTFENNAADVAGGAMFVQAEHGFSTTIANNSLLGNAAATQAGAVNLEIGLRRWGGAPSYGDVVLAANTFNGNTAPLAPGVLKHELLGGGARVLMRSQGNLGEDLIHEGRLTFGVDGTGMAVVDGDFEQRTVTGAGYAGELWFKLGGVTPGTGHDALIVGGLATLSGLVNVSLVDDYAPQYGDSFTVLSAASIEGSFDAVLLPKLPAGLFLQIGYESGGAGAGAGESVVLTVNDVASLLGFGGPIGEDVAGLPTDIALAHLNGDEHLDIALALDGDPGFVLVLYNDGEGGFDPEVIPVGSMPSALALGDLHGNGRVDIAVTNRGDNTVSILENTGAGFVLADTFTVGSGPSAIVAGEFRSPGLFDLAVTNAGGNSLHIYHNDGSGSFSQAQSIGISHTPVALQAHDFDGDGHLDLAAVRYGLPEPPPETPVVPGAVAIITNNGNGNFSVASTHNVGLGAVALNIEDLDNNKDLDIVVSNAVSQTISVLRSSCGGSFSAPINLAMGGKPSSLVGLDIDGDGDVDLAVIVDDPDDGRTIRVLRNDSPAVGEPGFGQLIFQFDPLEDELAQIPNPLLLAAGDITGDGTDDLITINGTTQIGGRSGAPGAPGSAQASLNVWPAKVCAGDITCDGAVSVADLLILLSSWGSCPGPCPADLNEDGVVNVADLLTLLTAWGSCTGR